MVIVLFTEKLDTSIIQDLKAVNHYFGNGFFVNYAKTSISMQSTSIAIFLDTVPPIKNELNEKVATEDPDNPVFSHFLNV